MSKLPTPRVDAVLKNNEHKEQPANIEYLMTDLARQMEAEIITLTLFVADVMSIVQPLAGNRHFMQVAGPARRICNLYKDLNNDLDALRVNG